MCAVRTQNSHLVIKYCNNFIRDEGKAEAEPIEMIERDYVIRLAHFNGNGAETNSIVKHEHMNTKGRKKVSPNEIARI